MTGPELPIPSIFAPVSVPAFMIRDLSWLVLAICAWVLCPVILAIVALVMANTSDRAIRESGGRLTGHGFNRATRWISWINIVFAIVGTILLILLVAFAFTQGSTIPLDPDTQF